MKTLYLHKYEKEEMSLTKMLSEKSRDLYQELL